MRMRASVLAALVGSVLISGTALAAPGDPFGGDDSGFIPPDAITQKCEAKVSKYTAKFLKCVAKCHISLAKQKFTSGAEEGCEAICEGKFDIGIGKVTNAGPPACPPACMSPVSIRSVWEGVFDGNNGQIYCEGTTAFGGDDPGFVPTSAASLVCETKLEKVWAKLGACYMKCHDSRAKEKTDAAGEDTCESGCDTAYSTKVAGLLGCAPCVMTNAPTIATGLKNNANSNNSLVYCAF